MTAKIQLQRRSLGEQVTELLREMILKGDFSANERLVEEQLAQRIGASRTPIREALHRLERENLLQKRPKGGYTVKPLTSKEVEEAVGLRAALESYAVELASKKMTPKLLKELNQNVDRFASALIKGDQKKLIELNTEFHDMLYKAADSSILSRLINEMHDLLHRFRITLLSDTKSANKSLQDHRKLLKALTEKDETKAALICRKHVLAGGTRILAQLKNNKEKSHE